MQGIITDKSGIEVLRVMLDQRMKKEPAESPSAIVARLNLAATRGDDGAIMTAITEALDENPKGYRRLPGGQERGGQFPCRADHEKDEEEKPIPGELNTLLMAALKDKGGVIPVHLIVAEKNISARRIAEILGEGKKITERKDAGVSTYTFGDTTTVGLRGHVVEIDFEPGYTNWRSESATPRSLIDAKTIKRPTEPRIVSLVQKLAKQADRVTIATDFDTEGELIGKEAYELVRAVNPKVTVDRARFSAITSQELRHAFSNTTDLDFALAAAGEARQSIDLMWGAALTRFITLAAKRGGQNILSVGRVQSPTLSMIVDREKEIEAFVPEKYWQLGLLTEKAGEKIEARHTNGRFHEKALAEIARDRTKAPLVVTEVKTGSKQDRAPSPFDTTTYIVATARLGLSAANAMRIAEDLYMNGYISYPRTDNTVYPPSLDLDGILKTIRNSPFKKDVDMGDGEPAGCPDPGQEIIHRSPAHPPDRAGDPGGDRRRRLQGLRARPPQVPCDPLRPMQSGRR